MKLSILVGSGRKIGIFTLPFLIIGVALNILFPSVFLIGDSQKLLTIISLIVLFAGMVVWIWTVYLILTIIPRKKLITSGPYSIVKHPLYTGVAFLVFPWVGVLFHTWLGAIIGVILHIGSRLYSPEEEKILSAVFGKSWKNYCRTVKLKWL